MLAVTKIYLRHELRQAKRAGDYERIALIEQVFSDPDLLQLVHDSNQAEYEYAKDSQSTDANYENPFVNFLRWLIENKERIFKFVLQIIQLLSILEPPPPKEDDK